MTAIASTWINQLQNWERMQTDSNVIIEEKGISGREREREGEGDDAY